MARRNCVLTLVPLSWTLRIAGSAVAALALALPAAAAAQDLPVRVDGTDVYAGTQAGPVLVAGSTIDGDTPARRLNQTATAQELLSPRFGRTAFALECSATAFPNQLDVRIRECYLLGANGSRYHAPASPPLNQPSDVIVSTVVDVPIQLYRVCVSSVAFYQDNYYLQAPPACSTS